MFTLQITRTLRLVTRCVVRCTLRCTVTHVGTAHQLIIAARTVTLITFAFTRVTTRLRTLRFTLTHIYIYSWTRVWLRLRLPRVDCELRFAFTRYVARFSWFTDVCWLLRYALFDYILLGLRLDLPFGLTFGYAHVAGWLPALAVVVITRLHTHDFAIYGLIVAPRFALFCTLFTLRFTRCPVLRCGLRTARTRAFTRPHWTAFGWLRAVTVTDFTCWVTLLHVVTLRLVTRFAFPHGYALRDILRCRGRLFVCTPPL